MAVEKCLEVDCKFRLCEAHAGECARVRPCRSDCDRRPLAAIGVHQLQLPCDDWRLGSDQVRAAAAELGRVPAATQDCCKWHYLTFEFACETGHVGGPGRRGSRPATTSFHGSSHGATLRCSEASRADEKPFRPRELLVAGEIPCGFTSCISGVHLLFHRRAVSFFLEAVRARDCKSRVDRKSKPGLPGIGDLELANCYHRHRLDVLSCASARPLPSVAPSSSTQRTSASTVGCRARNQTPRASGLNSYS